MIAFLEGIIAGHEADGVLLAIGGIGYRIFCARETGETGEVATFWITEIIREDKHDLYGFLRREDQALFEQLMGVSGVGPKLAQKILSSGSVESLVQRIQAGDIDMLTSIGGVGKKTAQKIILDLKGVLVAVGENGEKVPRSDVTDALESLGYSKSDIAEVAQDIIGETTEARVKSALKLLSRHV
ncbi:MAG: Holliday junction branch migration protein RuvA [Patescibacteria group bacterium]|jgi:Holliday junction DNA helicase RuvA